MTGKGGEVMNREGRTGENEKQRYKKTKSNDEEKTNEK